MIDLPSHMFVEGKIDRKWEGDLNPLNGLIKIKKKKITACRKYSEIINYFLLWLNRPIILGPVRLLLGDDGFVVP